MSYAIALFLLLLNDHVLKYAFPGFITGKLSDFAGVFAFAAFFASAMPRRAASVCAATGALFVWWKSPLSQPVVDALGLSRVVDWTDLAALIVLPFAYRIATKKPIQWRPAIVCVSLFAFAATSGPRTLIEIAKDDPLRHVETNLPIEKVMDRVIQCDMQPDFISGLHVRFEAHSISKQAEAWASVRTEPSGIVLEFTSITVTRPGKYIDERAVRDEFAERFQQCLHK